MDSSSNPTRISEADVAAALGVPVEVVRKQRPRRLSGNVHYWSQAGVYVYSLEAVELLRGQVTPAKKEEAPAIVSPPDPLPTAPPAPPAEEVEKKEGGPVRLSLLKAKPSGRHWNAAVVGNEKAGTVVVDVRNGAHFRQGMELEADPLPGQPGYFYFPGKLPRSPGKW